MTVEIRRPDIDEACGKNSDHERETCCVCRTVKFIDTLQRKFATDTNCISCDAPRLGMNVPGVNQFNTRPFILYLENGEPFAISYDILDPTATTTVFRVESVRDCCAVLRALIVGGTPEELTFTPTTACVTVDLCEFIGIQCLPDTFINGV
ncbi:MAG: spore coat protein Z [Bacilli bacterium]|nr:spore coat protein Z [Bacilli bacterium]